MSVPRRRRKPPLDPLSLKRRVQALAYRQLSRPAMVLVESPR